MKLKDIEHGVVDWDSRRGALVSLIDAATAKLSREQAAYLGEYIATGLEAGELLYRNFKGLEVEK